jgi:hypothetical protein
MATQFAFGKIVTDGLVLAYDAADRNSYISGSTTWRDLSGNNYSGSLTNGPTFNSANGGSIVFDGTNDFAQTSTTNFTAQNDFTISIFASSSVYTTSNGIIANKGYWQAGGQGVAIGNISSPQTVYAYVTTNTTHTEINSGVGPTYNWTNFTLRRNVNSLNFFANGILKGSGTISGTVTDLLNYFFIAKYNASNTWNGGISNCLIYSRALSNTEILQNYNAQKSRFNL